MTETTLPEEPLVLVHKANSGIATVTLNRPQQFNALSRALMQALQDALDAIAVDPGVRAVVLAGSGKAFCAGHDLKEMRQNPAADDITSLFEQCARLMMTIPRLPQPVIARVHGIATAAGCQLVAACDLAVAQDTARFAVSGVNLGLFCSTPMVALTRNLPRKQAMEMLLTGDFIGADTALACGLVNRVVPADMLDNAVAELAAKIAAKSAAAISLGKALFYKQLEADLETAYELAVATMTCNMLTEDAGAGIDAFVAKQPPPPWKGR
jgi:enoyl-CoA hydratase/carnithine racemase